jgi:hypothetical protein
METTYTALTSARATFVAQLPAITEDPATRFEDALDHSSETLRRAGRAEVRRSSQRPDQIELRCEIEFFGPMHVSDRYLRRLLKRALHTVIRRMSGRAGAEGEAVFDIRRRDLSGEDVGALVIELKADADNVDLPLTVRLTREHLAARLPQLTMARTSHVMGHVGARTVINWEGEPVLQVTKMLAHVIRQHERPSCAQLWTRVEQLLPQITGEVLGESVTLQSLCEHFPITPEKLAGRADHAERYGEINEYLPAVEAA